MDSVHELLEDDSFDPKKLFNEEEFSTLIIKRDGFSKKENINADIVESFLEPNISRIELEELFLKLKETKSQHLLIKSINDAQRIEEKIILTSACWECCLDFSNQFLFFVELACHSDFKLAFEALTVVENSEGTIAEGVLAQALNLAQHSKSPNNQLLEDLIQNIKQRVG